MTILVHDINNRHTVECCKTTVDIVKSIRDKHINGQMALTKTDHINYYRVLTDLQIFYDYHEPVFTLSFKNYSVFYAKIINLCTFLITDTQPVVTF